jgi:hypothetical protein
VRPVDTLPVRRQIVLEFAALATDDPGQPGPDLLVPLGALGLDPQPALEAERKAHVEKFEQVDVAARILLQPRQQVEEPVPGHAFAVERGHHALLRPVRCPAPGRVQNDVVQRRADRVFRDLELLRVDAGLKGAGLERADLGHDRAAQGVRIGMLGTVADAPEQREQRRPAGMQRVHAGNGRLRVRCRAPRLRWRGSGMLRDAERRIRRPRVRRRGLRDRLVRRWGLRHRRRHRRPPATRIGTDHGLFRVIRFAEGVIVDHVDRSFQPLRADRPQREGEAGVIPRNMYRNPA